eukprot:SAG11_NODE_890_length_6689_cov_18.947951_6_plen_73_part_00
MRCLGKRGAINKEERVVANEEKRGRREENALSSLASRFAISKNGNRIVIGDMSQPSAHHWAGAAIARDRTTS